MKPEEAFISGYMHAIAEIHNLTAKTPEEYGNKVKGFVIGIFTRNSLDIESKEKTKKTGE